MINEVIQAFLSIHPSSCSLSGSQGGFSSKDSFRCSQHFTVHLFRDPQIPVGSKSDGQHVCVPQPKTLQPKKVLYRQNYMTSVLAVRQKAWMVFFVGTGDGQLIKVRAQSDMCWKGNRFTQSGRLNNTACVEGAAEVFLQPLCSVMLKTLNGKTMKNPSRRAPNSPLAAVHQKHSMIILDLRECRRLWQIDISVWNSSQPEKLWFHTQQLPIIRPRYFLCHFSITSSAVMFPAP